MGETPLWTLVASPVALALLAYAAAVLDRSLGAVAAGHRGALRAWGEPARGAVRLLVQQRRATFASDRLLARIGVLALPVAALLAAVVIPLGTEAVAGMRVGVVWFNAMEVGVWGAVWLTGWGANSAYALIGGYRFLAQGLAYELPHMFALITAALGAGSLDLAEVAAAQHDLWFAVWMPVAFAVYLISAAAMVFWGPLDHPVGADLAGGAAVELSGPDRLVFMAGRYALLVVVAAAAVPLFLGGDEGPLLPAPAWSLIKTSAVLALLVWTAHRLPVLRMDRFVAAAWTVLIPAALLQALVVAIVVVG
ncbi:NADH-quinone oxidoreductase subunit H [Actinomadura sp. NBRC 104412]|uniref:complex I subunit 1 family protein n=1 Tax=Actinomadura sp. NBRC 104412 TaxID=3032203 RepID=UPI0024A1D393|nr:complex I subunit 1 family protein [Actinomadura sp. NBRC 104412]GLZ08093.1 NADH-quinone oxidoreductase subunit H [Actinomadura sp. NBRC 104412]